MGSEHWSPSEDVMRAVLRALDAEDMARYVHGVSIDMSLGHVPEVTIHALATDGGGLADAVAVLEDAERVAVTVWAEDVAGEWGDDGS